MTAVPSETIRLFFALWPDDAVRDALRTHADAWRWPPQAARVHAEDFHITLHFLGNVAQDGLPVLEALRVPFEPFTLHLQQVERWPHGIAVLRPQATPRELTTLQTALGYAIAAHGLRVDERDYRPHVTLARKAALGVAPPEVPCIEWRVERYVLVQSRIGVRPRYLPICDYAAN